MDKSKNENQKNVYKYTTFGLIGLIVIFSMFFIFNFFVEKSYTQGYNYGVIDSQNAVLKNIMTQVQIEGFVSLNAPNNQSLILVNSKLVENAQSNVVKEIFDILDKDGYVTLNAGNQSLVLVPYDGNK